MAQEISTALKAQPRRTLHVLDFEHIYKVAFSLALFNGLHVNQQRVNDKSKKTSDKGSAFRSSVGKQLEHTQSMSANWRQPRYRIQMDQKIQDKAHQTQGYFMKSKFIKHHERIVYEDVKRGLLKVDNAGQIWRLKKQTWKRAEYFTGRYFQVSAKRHNCKRPRASAARLVWHHFHGPIPEHLTVNHKDGNKLNNNPQNLELMTIREQVMHRFCVLGQRQPCGEHVHNAKLATADVKFIFQARKSGYSIKEMMSQFKISRSAVQSITRGHNWKHLKLTVTAQ